MTINLTEREIETLNNVLTLWSRGVIVEDSQDYMRLGIGSVLYKINRGKSVQHKYEEYVAGKTM